MLQLTLIAFGGALGALGRFWINEFVHGHFAPSLPLGNMIANVIGSFAIGFLYVAVVEQEWAPETIRPLLMVGFLGALTTFSTFSLDAVNLMASGRLGAAALYIIASVLICLLATAASMAIARLVF